jgi:hypothetical protein
MKREVLFTAEDLGLGSREYYDEILAEARSNPEIMAIHNLPMTEEDRRILDAHSQQIRALYTNEFEVPLTEEEEDLIASYHLWRAKKWNI